MQRTLKPELKIAAAPALLQRGCVNVIGLEEIRFEAGLRWEKIRPSIYAHLESLLRQKLSSTDFYIQLDDTSFLVTMPAAAPDESQIFCLRIAHELHTSLLGRCDISQLRIARATRSEGDVLELTPVTGDGLIRLAAQAGLPLGAGGPAIAPTRTAPQADTRDATRSHQFVPMWDVQKEAITTYRCETLSDQPAFDSLSPQVRFKADLAATLSRIHHATQALADDLKIGQRLLMSVPISFDMLSSSVARMEISALCRSLSSGLRPYLLFEIDELPYGVPQSRLSELVGSLRPFCRGVAAQLPARIHSYGAYQGAGLYAIGLSLAPSAFGTAEMGSEAFKLCTAAKRLHIRSFILDIPNLEILRTVYALGVNNVSGPLLGRPLDAPAPIRRLPARDIPGLVTPDDFIEDGPRTGTAG
jgi:hypothetical protein